jgi:Derlin-2/3
MFMIFLLVSAFTNLEGGYFAYGNEGLADFTFMLSFGWALMMVVSYFWPGLFFMGPALVFYVLYVWSRKDPYRQVKLYGFAFTAWHYPFVLMLVGMLFGGSIVLDIVGVLVGHVYHFLVDVVPKVWNKTMLRTPPFFYQIYEAGNVHQRNTSWQQGAGHRLG